MLLILLAVVALVTGFLVFRAFINSPVAAWASLLLLCFVTQATTLFGGVAGGAHVYPGDALTVLLLAAGIVRIAPIISRNGLSALLTTLLMLLVAFSMIRGIPESGLSAVNASRPYLAISSALLYFSTFLADDTRLKKYIDLYIWYCAALVLLAMIRYAGLDGGLIAPSPDFRPLPAGGAYSIAVGFLACLCRRHYYASSRFMSSLTPVFGAMAIILQHRTVWIVFITMMASAIVADLSLVKKLIPVFVVGSLLCGVLGAVIYGSQAHDQFETSATNEGTFLWRVQGWMALLNSDEQTPFTYAVGLPAGARFAQTEEMATASGHSEYISALSHVGVLGLCVLLGIILRPAMTLYGLRRMDGILAFPGPVFWVIFLVSVLAYGFTYTISWDQAALIGIANSIVITRSRVALIEADAVYA